jgi:hypothetical protein
LFTVFFVPAQFLIAGLGAWATGNGLRIRSLAWALAWRAGLGTAGVFLVVNLLMEARLWRVGALGAAELFTMLTELFAGDLCTAWRPAHSSAVCRPSASQVALHAAAPGCFPHNTGP